MAEADHELSALCRHRPIAARAYDYAAGDRTGAHSHRAAQVVYAVSGAMSVEAHKRVWVVPPLRAVWIPPRTRHAVVMHSCVSMRTVYLTEEMGGLFEGECCALSVSALLRELIVEATRLPPDYRLSGRNRLIVRLLIEELERSRQVGLSLVEPEDRRLRQVTEAIRANPGDNRTLGCWARVANASERTLARLFLRETGLTFGQWRQQAQLLAAIVMLARGKSVTTIALDLGYATPSAFSYMFRRALGCAPSAYFARHESDAPEGP